MDFRGDGEIDDEMDDEKGVHGRPRTVRTSEDVFERVHEHVRGRSWTSVER